MDKVYRTVPKQNFFAFARDVSEQLQKQGFDVEAIDNEYIRFKNFTPAKETMLTLMMADHEYYFIEPVACIASWNKRKLHRY
tara:strand:+ start:3837 stop:4082 length:246 start_codon:yes stop_codon:yes gene_type:complete